MTKRSDEIYNSNLQKSGNNANISSGAGCSGHHFNHQFSVLSQQHRRSDLITGGKLPIHGPRRFSKPAPISNSGFVSASNVFAVSKSEVENYNIICKLASSQYQCEDAVNIFGVRCTFWSLGDSLKPGGFVKSFVVSAFCFSLFQKPNGHPDSSKRHYFFPNIADNLLKDYDEADQQVLSRAFTKSSKARPLNHSNMLFFPTCFEDHWFVFIVDLKDRKDHLFSITGRSTCRRT